VVLAGAISTGAQIAAARMMGADLAYLGTRFLATAESMADPEHKQMILRARAKDIVYTPAISGVSANFLAESLRSNGAGMKPQDLSDEVKAWKTVWSAGQGVGSVNEILPATELCRKLIQEYKAAHAQLTPPFS
jgi:nitronate monooxygenase